MKIVESYSFEPTYKRDNGLVVVDTQTLPLPAGFTVTETSAVHLPAGQVAGNHRHPRQEAYVCLDEGVELHWLDDAAQVHVEQMAQVGNSPRLFVVPAQVPHAVVNKSGHNVTLLGYADGPFEEVGSVTVVEPANSAEVATRNIVQATKTLAKLQPGFLPFVLFHEVTRLVVTPIVEVVPLRTSADGAVAVLLLKREADDPVWPGQLHVPGTVVRASDTPGSLDDAFERVLSKELGGTKTSRPTFVKNVLHHSGRGMEASQIFWVAVQGEPAAGEFFDVNDLPQSIVQSQLDFIPDAIAHFKAAA